MSRRLSFLAEPDHTAHTREYMRGLSRALERAGVRRRSRNTLTWWGSRVAAKVHAERNLLRLTGADARIVGVAWPRDGGGFPDVLWTDVIPFVSDCWPQHYDRWVSKLRRMGSPVIFVSAQGSADYLREQLPDSHVYWIPEGFDPAGWSASIPLRERDLDVVELGRNYPTYHQRITGSLRDGVSHRFATNGSQTPIFPGLAALKSGLGNTKIQICFPKSITHPDEAPDNGAGAGGLETVTQRYFEAIASGSVVVGHSPRELAHLFGYDPVIAADLDGPVEQLHELLDHIEDYQDAVTRNVARLHEVGTWDARVAEMLRILKGHGYEAPDR